MSRRTTSGFTLLEMLVALSIFSIMATLAYGGVRLVLDGREQIELSASGLSSAQRVFLLVQQDLQQATSRAVHDEYGTKEPALIGGEDDKLLYLTRNGAGNMPISSGVGLRRVEYQLENGHLYRRVWSVLDRVQGSRSSRLRLVEGVEHIELKFLDYSENQWHGNWPPAELDDAGAVPKAIEIKLTIKSLGEISRLIVVGS